MNKHTEDDFAGRRRAWNVYIKHTTPDCIHYLTVCKLVLNLCEHTFLIGHILIGTVILFIGIL